MKTNFRTVNTPMATASLACGVAAVVCLFICMFPFAICLGALAVIFAMLSRTGKSFLEHAKIGFICGIIALAVNLLLILIVSGLLLFSVTFRDVIQDTFTDFYSTFSEEFEGNRYYYNDYDYDDYNDYDDDYYYDYRYDIYEDETT